MQTPLLYPHDSPSAAPLDTRVMAAASIPPRHPLYAVSQAYRRSLVRLWTERLRQIEGRLNPGCGLRWDQQLAACDDIQSIARLDRPLTQP